MATDPPTWGVIEKFEADHPELAATSEFFFRTNFFNSFMDVLGDYIDWREGGKRPNSFLNRQLKNWGIQSWIGEYPSSAIKKMLASGGSTLQLNDEAAISTVLAQLFYDRKTVTADRKKALISIDRQASDAVLTHLHYPDLASAKKDFAGLRTVIETKLG
ncbi:MAG: hypothetical protein AAGH89_10840 [Verrucomicrobiota bacterium]